MSNIFWKKYLGVTPRELMIEYSLLIVGFMVPIIKDHSGNNACTSNYRGITISPIVSKLFEHVLKLIFFDALSTSEHQFGFEKNSSTVHASIA